MQLKQVHELIQQREKRNESTQESILRMVNEAQSVENQLYNVPVQSLDVIDKSTFASAASPTPNMTVTHCLNSAEASRMSRAQQVPSTISPTPMDLTGNFFGQPYAEIQTLKDLQMQLQEQRSGNKSPKADENLYPGMRHQASGTPAPQGTESRDQQRGKSPVFKDKNCDLDPGQSYESPARGSFLLSTQLFNGDYLAAQAAEDGSPHRSRNILPHQVLLKAGNASVGKFSQFDQSSRRPRGGQARNQLLGQSFQYINGPQINQINVHVHFNNTTTTNAPILHAPEAGARWQPVSQRPLQLGHIGNNSKETLNQSSSHQISMKRRNKSNLNDSSRMRQAVTETKDHSDACFSRNAQVVTGLQNVNLYNNPTLREHAQVPLDSKGTMEEEPWKRSQREFSPLDGLSGSGESPLDERERAGTVASGDLNAAETAHKLSTIETQTSGKLIVADSVGEVESDLSPKASLRQAELLNKVDTAPISALGTSPDTKAASLRATANRQMFESAVPPRETNTIGTEQQIQDSEQQIMDSQDFINQFIQQISNQQPLQPSAMGQPLHLHTPMNPVITTNQISQATERALRMAQAQPSYLDRQIDIPSAGPGQRQPSMMSNVKRQKAKRRSKRNASHKAPQLHVYNYLAKKVETQAGLRHHDQSVGSRPLVADQRAPLVTGRYQHAPRPNIVTSNEEATSTMDLESDRYWPLPLEQEYASDRLNKMFNTMTHQSGPWHRELPMQTMQGPFQGAPSGQDAFESQFGSTYKSTGDTGKWQAESHSRNDVGNMNRTIMPVAAGRWQGMGSSMEAGKRSRYNRTIQEPMLNTARYAPNSTGYSSVVGASQSVDCTVDRMTDVQVKRDLRLHPARQSLGGQHSNAMGSTCLLSKPMLDGVGQFKKRAARPRETFGQRNARLGHLATRTSYGAFLGDPAKKGFRVNVHQLNQPSKSDINEGAYDIAQRTESSWGSKFGSKQSGRAIAREMREIERSVVLSAGTDRLEETEEVDEDKEDDIVLYQQREQQQRREERQRQTEEEQQKRQRRNRTEPKGQEFSSIKTKDMDMKLTTENVQHLVEAGKAALSPTEMSQLMGSINASTEGERHLLEKLQSIVHAQKTHPPQQVTCLVPVQSPRPNKTKSPKRSSRERVNVRKAGFGVGNLGDQVIRGEAMLSAMNQTMPSNFLNVVDQRAPQPQRTHRPQGRSPFRHSPRNQTVPPQSHTVVVETPETPGRFGKGSGLAYDLKQRLDIKIRCPLNIIANGLLDTIQRRLSLRVTLIYYDGTHSLDQIKKRELPTYARDNVAIDPQGFVYELRNDKRITKLNLYQDIFNGALALNDLNFKQSQYLVEVELTDPEKGEMYLLRYLTFNHLTQSIYPKIYISVMQHLAAKQQPVKMFDGNADEVLEFRKEDLPPGNSDLDELFEKLVAQDISFPLLMKTKPKLECPRIKLPGIILESPKRKVQLRGLAEFGSLTDGRLQKVNLRKSQPNESASPRKDRSHDTLNFPASASVSQYVAISVKNHELTDRHNQSQLAGIVDEDLPLGFIPQSPSHPKKTLPAHLNSNVNTQVSQTKVGSSFKLKEGRNLKEPPKLNYDSTAKFLQAPDMDNPSMQIKQIARRRQYTPQKEKDQGKKSQVINKQQFHVEANLDKGIDCTFESLGSSEGRHSSQEERELSHIGTLDNERLTDGEGGLQKANTSRQHLFVVTNLSEHDEDGDGPADHFGQERLQSIFQNQKRASELQEKMQTTLGQASRDKIDGKKTLQHIGSPWVSRETGKSSIMNQTALQERRRDTADFSTPERNKANSKVERFAATQPGASAPPAKLTQAHFSQDGVKSTRRQLPSPVKGLQNKRVKREELQSSVVNIKVEDDLGQADAKPHGATALKKGTGAGGHPHVLAKQGRISKRKNLRHALAQERGGSTLVNPSMLDIQQKAINQTVYKTKSTKKLAEKEMPTTENDHDSVERESLLGSAHTTGFGPEAAGAVIQSLTLTKKPAGLDGLDGSQLVLTMGPQPIQAIIENRGPSPTRIRASGYSIPQTPQSGTATPTGTKSSQPQRGDST